MVAWTLVFHVLGITLWVGGLLAVSLILVHHVEEPLPTVGESLARLEQKILRFLVDPGAAITIIAGILLIWSNPHYYLHASWLHVKLTLVALLIAQHIVLAMRIKAYSRGLTVFTSKEAWLFFAAILVNFLMILIATLPGEVYFARF